MYNERLRRYGATASTIVALGGVGITSAKANPNHPAAVRGVEKSKLPKTVPDGVKSLNTYESIQKDIAKCLPRINKRWNGVLVLHDPKKENAAVSFATSPRSYVAESADFLVNTLKGGRIEYKVIPTPAIVSCDNRDYAVISDVENGGTYGFLDIKFAEEVGALDLYAFKGVKPQAKHHTYSSETNDLPFVHTSEYYEPEWAGPNKDQILTSIYLPISSDPHRKLYKLAPSSVVPHP